MDLRYTPPLEIHVCWSELSEPSSGLLEVADEVHRRLGHWVPPGGDATPASKLHRGAGIPVLLGTPYSTLLAQLKRDKALPAGAPRTNRIIVGLFDLPAYRNHDAGLVAFIKEHGNAVVALEERYETTFEGMAVLPERSVVDRLAALAAGVLSLRPGEKVKLFVDDPVGGKEGADAIWSRVTGRKLDDFLERVPLTLGGMREHARSSILVHIRRDATVTFTKDRHVLLAKELTMPVVSAISMAHGDEREAAYSGNAPAVVVDTNDPASVNRLVDEVTRAWLSHANFVQDASRLARAAGLPLSCVFLSRPPELVDFANGALSNASAVVVHPDPPLSADASRVLTHQYPRLRLLTPTTIYGQILGPSARPPLDGFRVALSLSDSPQTPFFTSAPAATWEGPRHQHGLTDRHYRDVVEFLSVCLVRAGAELAYGGNFDSGHSLLLSRIIAAHRPLDRDPSDLLHVYLRGGALSGDTREQIRARFHPVKGATPAPRGSVQGALALSAMRRMMATECDARIVLGGRTTAAARKDGVAANDGYSGRFPGQAEEAWTSLFPENLRKPLYVIGAFGGSAADVGRALRGEKVELREDAVEGFEPFREEVDALDTELPKSLPELWAALGTAEPRLVSDDTTLMCANGLTVGENKTLLESQRPAEIAALVMRGLLRVSRRRAKDSPLALMPYNGSITASPAVHVYVVPVAANLQAGGADRALDELMNGELSAARKAPVEELFMTAGHIEVVPVRTFRLAGQWVAMVSLGDASDSRQSDPFELGRAVGAKAAEQGWTEIATVPLGGNLLEKADLGDRVKRFVNGLRQAEGQQVRTLVMCEWDSKKFESLKIACQQLRDESGGQITTKMLKAEPVPPRQGVVSSVLRVRQEGDELVSELIPPRTDTLSPTHRAVLPPDVAAALKRGVLDLTDADLPRFVDELRSAVLSASSAAQLADWTKHPVRVYHDEASSSIPFELILTSGDQTFALEQGVSRSLQTASPAPPRQSAGRGEERLRVLMVADPTQNLPRSLEEAENLERDLDLRGVDVVKRLTGANATREAVLAALTKENFNVLHYCGHASPAGLALHDNKLLRPSDLESVPPDRMPSLVILNACQSASIRPSGDETLARWLLGSGVRCFIGTGWFVPDSVAARFGVRMLREVADAIPVGIAFARTLRAMRYEHFDALYWFYYRLYGDADFVWR